MSLILPPAIVHEPMPPRSETITVGKLDEYQGAMNMVRTMITMAIGTLKEVKAQVREKPGARFLIGEILSCLGDAKKATNINPTDLNFKRV